MAGTFLLEYIEKDSVIHRLNGATKLICFILWTVAIMFTYDTRLLLALTFLGFVLFRISQIKFNEINPALLSAHPLLSSRAAIQGQMLL